LSDGLCVFRGGIGIFRKRNSQLFETFINRHKISPTAAVRVTYPG
jgi:hypothetical protein